MSALQSRDTALLPRLDRQGGSIPESIVPPAPRGNRVLLVDGDIRSRTVLRLVLKREGFDVLEGDDGFEAIELYKRFQETISVVLLAVHMPELDGPSTLSALRQLNPDICCCFLWDYLGKYRAEELCELGATTIFTKPLAMREVVNVLCDLADRACAAHPGK